ncbi:hypothetical protein FRACYDRAFT_248530 [Fragilariopsis cylindrus CCMP1102]|uniref:Uncharacterized protein n=1 Tax=Fragilariopsis cylindrus CCMP1102 TaxID=635003 RepID=A0A1E7ETM3_9STRA|nr:hypothetical protein FRACYDRAFT_248530 [Fragilariopsis cylindrus CCMP1102]|eukprot:OEU09196.1 hypothetical protein FRACYDRAFT_248530 [Fragilariopsis cylindrus CCMP1102]
MATNAKARVKVRLASDVEDPTLLEEELNTVPTVRSTMTGEKTRAEAQFVDLEDAKKDASTKRKTRIVNQLPCEWATAPPTDDLVEESVPSAGAVTHETVVGSTAQAAENENETLRREREDLAEQLNQALQRDEVAVATTKVMKEDKKCCKLWMVLLVALIVIAGIIAIGITSSGSDRMSLRQLQ